MKQFKRQNNSNTQKYDNRTIFSNLTFYTDEDATDETREAIAETLKETPFKKISFPLNCTRRYATGEDSEKCITIGFVKSFDSRNYEFSVTVFGKYADAVEKFKEPAIYIDYNTYEGKFTRINKISIIDAGDYTSDEDVNEATE